VLNHLTVKVVDALTLTTLDMLLFLAFFLHLIPRELLLGCEGLLLGVDPVSILSDELEGNSHIFGSHDSGLVLDAAHESRSSGSLGGIGADLDFIGLVVCIPERGACDGSENWQDHESAPLPHKHVDRYCNTGHREDLGHGCYGKEAQASIAANQMRELPPVDITVDRVAGGVEVRCRPVAEHLEGDACE